MQHVLISRCIAICHCFLLLLLFSLRNFRAENNWFCLAETEVEGKIQTKPNQSPSQMSAYGASVTSFSCFRPSYSLTACNTLIIGTTVNSGYKCPVGKTFLFFLFLYVRCIVYTAKKTYSSPARYIFSVTNYFDVS